ncbi:hypothetical protein CSA56_17215 [candidate division KSB3 bacterium]|uniref:histidine kinase n=1 Tax=candidate division KSB3 bacterium TaxID=2044937 RepID=A0A2G6K867_9BACT|nr:MAG: hypothetical protein CSA56_17215 [candidate division KSB3 bacterium]
MTILKTIPSPNLEKPLEERKIGGLGIYLTRALMDELRYRREKGKNVLWIKKIFSPKTIDSGQQKCTQTSPPQFMQNSFEMIPSGGDIFLKAISIHEQDDHFVRILFQDTGPDLDDENPENIFLPFYSTQEEPDSNFGLGLSVSYDIIKLNKNNY